MSDDPRAPSKWRTRATAALRRYFEERSYPRTILTLLLLLSGAAGFLVSAGLLRIGFYDMAIRYPVAVLAGYGVLLALVRGWVELEKDTFDPDDPAIKAALAGKQMDSKRGYEPTHRWWDWLDFANLDFADGDEGCIPVLLVGAVVVLIAAVLATLIGAPALVAEVFLDAFLVTVLYRRLRIAEKEHWLGTAIRKTWGLALVTAGALALIGWILEQLAPGAHSIGRAIERLSSG